MVFDSLISTMTKEGFHTVDNETQATVTLNVDLESDDWIPVYTEPQLFLGTEETERFASALSAALHTNILVLICYDGDQILLHFLNSDQHIDSTICFGDKIDYALTQKIDYSVWQQLVTDINVFQRIATQECTAMQTTWFDFQQLFNFPEIKDNIKEDPDSYCLYFQLDTIVKQIATENTTVDVRKQLSNYLKTLGFFKTKKFFVKKIIDELHLSVEIHRQARGSYYSSSNAVMQTDLPLYDLRIAVTQLSAISSESFLDASLNTLARVSDKYRIAELVYSSQEIVAAIKDDFEKYVYVPLFQKQNAFFGLFDYMCFLDYRTRMTIYYDSYDKALAAYYEHRFFEAMLCIKWMFSNFLLSPGTRKTDADILNISSSEIEYLRCSDKGDALKKIFSLYDAVSSSQIQLGYGLVPNE